MALRNAQEHELEEVKDVDLGCKGATENPGPQRWLDSPVPDL